MPLRELRGRAGAGPVRRLTPKALGVLLELAARPDEVVGRDELLARVWPDTLPTDDVLTQAVTQLRKAYAATVGPEPFIQTIAKSGYRLLVPVEWLPAAADGAVRPGAGDVPAVPVPGSDSAAFADAAASLPTVGEAQVARPDSAAAAPHGGRRRPPVAAWIGIAVAGLALSAALAWLRPFADRTPDATTRAAAATPVPAVQRVTSAPGAESAPTLSPDGRWLVYVAIPAGSTSPTLHVQSVTSAVGRVLIAPPATAADDRPAISPDGRRIAYRRTWPDGRCEVRAVGAGGAGDQLLAPCPAGPSPGLDWSPDSRWLVTAHAVDPIEPTRLHLLEVATGHWSPLATGAAAADAETMPRFTADGRAVVFVRNAPSAELWQVDVGGGVATRLVRLKSDVRGWQWLGSDAVVVSHFADGDFRLSRVRLSDGAASDLGQAWAREPSVARGAPWIAFVQGSAAYDLVLARVTDGRPAVQGLQPVLPSTGREVLPALAPDGDALLFASDRQGAAALWSARLSDPASLRPVRGITPQIRHAAVWSVDSRHALFAAYDADGRARMTEVDAATGTARVLPVPLEHPLQAAYGLPGEVLVVANGEGPSRLIRFDRRTTPWRVLAEWPDATRVRVAAGRAWFTRAGHAGLWSLPLSLDPVGLRHEDTVLPPRGDDRNWEVDARGRAWLIRQVPGCAAQLQRIGGPDSARRCLDAHHRAAINGFALAQDARQVLFSGVSAEEGDIALMPVPRG